MVAEMLNAALTVLMGTVYIRTGAHVTGHKMVCQWGRKLLLPAPHRACLPVCQRALAVPERAPEEAVRAWPAQAS